MGRCPAGAEGSESTLQSSIGRHILSQIERQHIGMRRYARSLRVNATDAERLLWSRLRRRQIAGFKFRRQHQVGLYICDFACLDRMLVVELDGSQHAENLEYDQRRDRFLRSAGFEVLRFWNNDVLGNIEGVLDTIYAALDRSSDPSAPAGHLPI